MKKVRDGENKCGCAAILFDIEKGTARSTKRKRGESKLSPRIMLQERAGEN
jgi:hypothetical protein